MKESRKIYQYKEGIEIIEKMADVKEDLVKRLEVAMSKLPHLEQETLSVQAFDAEKMSTTMEQFINEKMDAYIAQLAIVQELKDRINNLIAEMHTIANNRLSRSHKRYVKAKSAELESVFGRYAEGRLEDQASTGVVQIFNDPVAAHRKAQAELEELFKVNPLKIYRNFYSSYKVKVSDGMEKSHFDMCMDLRSGNLTFEEAASAIVKLKHQTRMVRTHKLNMRPGTKPVEEFLMPETQLSRVLNLKDDKRVFAVCDVDLLSWNLRVADAAECDPQQLKDLADTFKMILDRYIDAFCDQRLGMVVTFKDGTTLNMLQWSVSPSQQKQGKSYIIERETAKKVAPLVWCGLTPKQIKAKGGILLAKFWQYRCLWCTTTCLADVQEECKLTARKILIIKNIYVRKNVKNVDKVSDTYAVESGVDAEVVDKPYDGQMNQWVTTEDFQTRTASAQKGFAAACTNPHEWAAARGLNPIISGKYTLDGKDFDLREHPEVLAVCTEDFAKTIKLYNSQEEYNKICEANGIAEMPICAVAHADHKQRHTSRQILAACWWLEYGDLCKLVSKSIERYNKRYHTAEGAFEFLAELDKPLEKRSALAQLLNSNPEFANTFVCEAILMECARSDWHSIMAGNYDIDADYLFYVTEPDALWEIVIGGVAPEEAGELKDGEICVPDHPEDRKGVLARHPLMADNCLYPVKVRFLKKYAGHHVLYVGLHGLADRSVDGDHDGDEVLYIREIWFHDALVRAIDKFGIRRLIFDAVSIPDAIKAKLYDFPQTPEEYAEKARQTLHAGVDNNMIGKASNWSGAVNGCLYPEMDPKTLAAFRIGLCMIRVFASQAVDAQKTSYLKVLYKKVLIEELTKHFGEVGKEVAEIIWNLRSVKVYSQRDKEWTNTRMDADGNERYLTNDEWDEITLPKMPGAVDRAADLFSSQCDCGFHADMSVYGEFTMERYSIPTVCRKAVCDEQMKDIILSSAKRTQYNADMIADIEADKPVGMTVKAELLFGCRKSQIDERYDIKKDVFAIAKHKDILDAKLKALLVDAVVVTKEDIDREEQAAMYLFNWCMRRTSFASKKAMSYWARMAQWIIKNFASKILERSGVTVEELPDELEAAENDYEDVGECW